MNRTIFTPGDRVHLLTIGQDRQLDGGHRPAVFDHIGHDGFARVHADGIGLPLVVELDRLVPEPEQVNELTVAQALATRTPAAEVGRCRPFCNDKDLHAADPTADDGGCWSETFSTALNVNRWVAGFPVIADVTTYQPADLSEPRVFLSLRSTGNYVGAEVQLTADEARRIARHLLTVANLTEG